MNVAAPLWAAMSAEQRTATLRHRFKMGHSRARIARELGVVHSTVTLWCKNHDIKMPPVAPPANAKAAWLHMPAKERRKVLETMLASGEYKSGAAVCAVLGCSKDALRKYAAKEGLTLPNGRGFNLPAVIATRFGKPTPVVGQGNVKPKPTPAVATRDVPVSYTTAPKRPAPDVATRVHVLDHKFNQCRFPLWPDAGRTPFAEMFYCGAPREDATTSYCAGCRKLIRRGAHPVEDREALLHHMHLMRRVRDRNKRG